MRDYNSTTKLGKSVLLGFVITQHLEDEQTLKSLVQYLDCGKVYIRSKENAVDFKITRLELLLDKIVPLFEKYPLSGSKAKDFADWSRIALLIKDKTHLTPEGLNLICEIKAGMSKKEI